MTRERLARLIWKLWKRRNYYKYWYNYELEDRKIWTSYLDNMGRKIQEIKKDNKDVSFD